MTPIVGPSWISRAVMALQEPQANAGDPVVFTQQDLVGDPRWANQDFQKSHRSLYLALDSVIAFLKAKNSLLTQGGVESRAKEKITAWIESDDFKADPQFGNAVLANLRQVLQGSERGRTVLGWLPSEAALPAVSAEQPNTPSAVPVGAHDSKKNLGFYVGVQNDSGVIALADQVGLPASALAGPEVRHLSVYAGAMVPVKDHVLDVSLSARLIGSSAWTRTNETDPMKKPLRGLGWGFGVGIGLKDPYSSHRAGMLLDWTAPAKIKDVSGSGAAVDSMMGDPGLVDVVPGEDGAVASAGVKTPGPVGRLMLYDAKPLQLNFKSLAGGKVSVGITHPFNSRMGTLVVVKDRELLPEGEETPVSKASNLFDNAVVPILGLELAFHPKGKNPLNPRGSIVRLTQPFRPGEGLPVVFSLGTSLVTQWNRAQSIPPISNSLVLLGGNVLGAKASAELSGDLALLMGLTSFSLGWEAAKSAQTRAEIWRRGNWWHKGSMLAMDTAYLIGQSVRAGMIRPEGRGREVVNFEGRAGLVSVGPHVLSMALGAATGAGWFGDLSDFENRPGSDGAENKKDKQAYWGSAGGGGVTGLLALLFVAPLSGNKPGNPGKIGRYTFTGGVQHLAEPNQDLGAADRRDMDRLGLGVAMASTLLSWGIQRGLDVATLKIRQAISGRR